jgi:hypothetical protein
MDADQAAYLETSAPVPGDEDGELYGSPYAEDMAEGGVEDDADEDNNSYGPGNADMRQKLNPLDETEFQNRVGIAVQAAENYIDTLITPIRVQAAVLSRRAVRRRGGGQISSGAYGGARHHPEHHAEPYAHLHVRPADC